MKVNYEIGCMVEGKKGNYIVIMEKLKNDINGCPKWKARVIILEYKNYIFKKQNQQYIITVNWKGYGNETQEAEAIIKEYEKTL